MYKFNRVKFMALLFLICMLTVSISIGILFVKLCIYLFGPTILSFAISMSPWIIGIIIWASFDKVEN